MEDKLEIGDKIYALRYGEIRNVETIWRVTKLYAVSGISKYRRGILPEGEVVRCGKRDTWASLCFYKISSPELDKKYKRMQMLAKINDFTFTGLSDEGLDLVIHVMEGDKWKLQ